MHTHTSHLPAYSLAILAIMLLWSCGGTSTTDNEASSSEALAEVETSPEAPAAPTPVAAELTQHPHPLVSAWAAGSPLPIDQSIDQLQNDYQQLSAEDGSLDHKRSEQFILASRVNALAHPDDIVSSDWLFKAGEIAHGIGRYDLALAAYQQVLDQFPDSERAAGATFMLAFLYDDTYEDYDRARHYYETFLEQYPDDGFADDATIMLQLLGKNDEEILEVLTQ